MDNMVNEIFNFLETRNYRGLTGMGSPCEIERESGIWIGKAGARHFPTGFSYVPKQSIHAEWGALLTGMLQIKCKEGVLEVKEGDMYFLPPNIEVHAKAQGNPFIIWFEVCGDNIFSFLDMCGFSGNAPSSEFAQHHEIRTAFEIAKYLHERPIGFNYYTCSSLWHFIAGRTNPHGISGKEYSQEIYAVIKTINKSNMNKMYSLSDLAEISGFSVEGFRKKFLSEVGISPIKYVLEQKIRMAKNLLADKNLSVCDVAFQLGFHDQYYFSRLFKKYEGVSPKKFIQIFYNNR